MADVYNGYVSKYLNRKVSEPLAQLLARTRVTPHQVTWAAFGVAVFSFLSFISGHNIIGGLLIQLSAIVDGIDGSLARRKGMVTEFGGFLDSLTDRYADILMVLGMTLWSLSHETYPGVWPVGFLAVAGILCLSYTRARIGAEHCHLFDKSLPSLASRDIRLFLMMLGGVSGQAYFCLMVITVLTNLVVGYRLISIYKYLGR
ncbi:MAG: CDP-alcohol phosphatidyltransferase family protein [Dehalococcoidales bacterium]|jgi:phosphatidylglycerophosphate synthase|nr:CDP-alcohol phosphatidyltransferase family protein [Dehalococcoidales bacterium]